MTRKHRYFLSLIALLCFATSGLAQLGIFSKEQRLELTRQWQGERFPDGRPKVPEEVLESLKTVDAEEAWGVLRHAGYPNQFEAGWKVINPGERLVGRVVTAVFMPLRPDVNAVIKEHGQQEGRVGAQNSWVIDTLQSNDVPVVDLFHQKIPGAAWKSKPCAYVVGTEDHTVNPELQRFVANRMGATTYEVASSHVAMLSNPDVVIEAILKLAASV